MKRVRFVTHPIRSDRRHRVNEEDVRVVLGRLPAEVIAPLREVHFNDRFGRQAVLGYADPGSGALALCAIPYGISFVRYQGCRPAEFGAQRGRQWPFLAVRRFMLYDVLLHELGHLQRLPRRSRRHGRVPGEPMAREFADYWRRRLWAQPFDHPDPVHNPPSGDPLRLYTTHQMEDGRFSEVIEYLLKYPHLALASWHRRIADAYFESGRYAQAEQHYQEAWDLEPGDFQHPAGVGRCRVMECHYREAVAPLEAALELKDDESDVYWQLGRALWRSGDQTRAELVFRKGLALADDCVALNRGYAEMLRLQSRPDIARYYKNRAEQLLST